MIAGRGIWIFIWYGILGLGLLGLWASVFWGRRTAWKNIDEVLRAFGTITVSSGMLLLLRGVAIGFGQLLLLAALMLFVVAFVIGRKLPPPERHDLDDEPDDEPRNPA
jgi:hypothetical protein